MKIRSGFVSNSSSSSFIVTFDSIPKSKQELKKILFGKKKMFGKDYAGNEYSTDQVAETVWNDMCSKLPNDWVDIGRNYHVFGKDAPTDPYEDYRNPPSQKEFDKYHKAVDVYLKEKLKKFVNKNKNRFTFVFDYGDDDGPYFGILEHGNLFERVKHIRISNH